MQMVSIEGCQPLTSSELAIPRFFQGITMTGNSETVNRVALAAGNSTTEPAASALPLTKRAVTEQTPLPNEFMRLTVLLLSLLSSQSITLAGADSGSESSRFAMQQEIKLPVAGTVRKDEVTATAFSRMPVDQVRSQMLQWLAKARPETSLSEQVTQLWADDEKLKSLTAEETLDLVVESFTVADDSVRQLVEASKTSGSLPAMNFEGVRSDAFFRVQVQLYQARWLTQHRYFDDALILLEPMKPEEVVDPATLFFYRAVCRLRLLQTAKAADDLTLLLKNTLDVPARFRAVADLMKQEAGIPPEGLTEVAQLMSDVQRRLDLGRADDPVQKRESDVIAALDKLLEEMEQQKKQQQQQSGDGGGNSESQPGQQGATQSVLKGSSGKGDADPKELTENGTWGMLDKQKEAQARELIRQQFPPNFLDAISRYTRRIAEQKK
jgi:hypothetical protein